MQKKNDCRVTESIHNGHVSTWLNYEYFIIVVMGKDSQKS